MTPSTAYDCQNGETSVMLTWSGANGPVQIHLLKPDGPAMTGFNDPSGSAVTGNWVTDGMQFFLVDQSGIIEATATARVNCGGTPDTLNQGLQGGSYFPLQVGNTWVYRYSDRAVTNSYFTRTITETVVADGMTWFVMDENRAGSHSFTLYRGDDGGNIWVATPAGTSGPATPQGQQMLLSSNLAKTAYAGPLGTFTDAASVTTPGLQLITSIFVRGIGLVNQSVTEVAGSSGGFFSGMDLVEARLNGVQLSVPAPSIHIGIESNDFDLTDQKASNCALPCYFAACGIAPPYPPDPMGTYRPCAQARLETSGTGDTVQLQLLDSTGSAVFSTTAKTDSAGDSLNYIQLPLYSAAKLYGTPFTLLPPGNYKLVGELLAAGSTTASSSIDVRVR